MRPVDSEGVRIFLKETYKLDPEHVETMLVSIKESLSLEFVNVEKGLTENDAVVLWKAAHSIKGALFNAGAGGWAEVAQKIEISAKSEEDVDYAGLFRELKDGVSAIL